MPDLRSLLRTAGMCAYIAVVDTFRRHSLAATALSLLFTYIGKINWYIDEVASAETPPGIEPMGFAAYIADDLLFFGAVLLAFWGFEQIFRRRWAAAVTTLLAVPVAVVAVCNVFWMRGTGGQLSAAVIEVGVTRFEEVLPVLEEGLGIRGAVMMLLGLLIVSGLAFVFKAKWKADGRDLRGGPAYTAAIPLLLLAFGGVGKTAQDTVGKEVPPGWRLIADNVFVGIGHELVSAPVLGPVPKTTPPVGNLRLQADRTPAQLPNIVLYLMEATAFRATSFEEGMAAQTPVLARMADEGLVATAMRSVLPHTTKSVFSMLCGRYPAMQHEILETADNYPMRCLPELLKQSGYTSAFFQSADGRFEDRARLVNKMGFDHFEALQNLSPAPEHLGYLAGDDAGLVEPVTRWAASQEGPFFITVLTSSTHHNYEVPSRMLSGPGNASLGEAPMTVRYLALVHQLDRVLGELVGGLEAEGGDRGLTVAVMGDHGEAFGEHGGYQHDNIFWEEGLHVPFVLWGVPQTTGRTVPVERSLMDTAPTLLDAAGIDFPEGMFDGRSLLRASTQPVRRYFSCWYENVCVGYVEGDTKFVYLPSVRSWVVYDLRRDPQELRPAVDPPEWEAEAKELYDWYNRHRYSKDGLTWSATDLFAGSWRCGDGPQKCTSGN